MHFSLFAISAVLTGFVAAQTQGQLPQCANKCVTTLLPSSCNLNPSCICSDSNFIDNISCCIFKACPESDQEAALNYAKTYCTPVGVTLPQSAGCAANATDTMTSTSMTSSATSGSAASSLASVTSSMSSAASSQSSVASSMASSASAAATSKAAAVEKLVANGLGLVGAMVGAIALL